MYKEVKGKANKLQYIPVKLNQPDKQDYWSYRIGFLNSRLGQMKKAKTPLYYDNGKYVGLPTKQHIILIMHGYSPDKNIFYSSNSFKQYLINRLGCWNTE